MATKNRVGISVRNNNIEQALRIFNRKVQNSGILFQYKENQEFKKPSILKREKKKKAVHEQKAYDRKFINPDRIFRGK